MIVFNKKISRKLDVRFDNKSESGDFNVNPRVKVSVETQVAETTLVKLARSKTSVISFLGML